MLFDPDITAIAIGLIFGPLTALAMFRSSKSSD
jgi:hypothetical protein